VDEDQALPLKEVEPILYQYRYGLFLRSAVQLSLTPYQVILVQPYWVVELFSNFSYFNNWEPANTWFHKTRPLEAIFRYMQKPFVSQ